MREHKLKNTQFNIYFTYIYIYNVVLKKLTCMTPLE